MTDVPGALSPLDEDGINTAVGEVLAALTAAGTLAELKEARLAHIGDASPLALVNRLIGTLDKTDKPTVGKFLSGARRRIAKVLTVGQETLEATAEEETLRAEAVDVTIPTSRTQASARHPLDVLIDGVCDFFTSMGWSTAEGPEVEHEWFGFDALNFGADHLARQMQNTFYIDGANVGAAEGQVADLVLHTHTSPVQARVMLGQQPPLYVTCPGRVFRSDKPDATHTPVSYQVEDLAVDRGLTTARLEGVLDHFAKAMFGPKAHTRLHPFFFPFIEPSAKIDLWFPQKRGGTGWIKWGNCGMVNPNVLTACGIGLEVYTGFTFGMDLERTLMLRHGTTDMRDIVEGDIRFSQQLGTTGRGD